MAWFRRLGNTFRSRQHWRDLEQELSFHLAERADDLRAEGLDAAEAKRRARLRFGNYGSRLEETYAMDINLVVEGMFRNLRQSVRALARTPLFTATVLLVLALGIGANSAVFSAIDAVLLRPLPFPGGDSLVQLTQTQEKMPQPFVAPVRLEEWGRLNSTFTAISGYYTQDVSETSGELPEKLREALVAPRFLEVLGVAPAVGRAFNSAEEHFGGPNGVLISDRLWRRRFDGDPAAVGKTIRLERSSPVVVGVMPPQFGFPDRDVDVWSVSPLDGPFSKLRDATWFTGVGRLKPGVSLAQARANLAVVQVGLGRQFPKPDAAITVAAAPLKESIVGKVSRSLWLLFGAVSLLLLIACTNIAALLLSRAAAREYETAARLALGASRLAVAGQLLTEVLVLAVTGALLGLGVAGGAAALFRSTVRDLPRVEEMHLNGTVVLYSLLCAVVVTMLCGLVPAVGLARKTLAASLARGGRAQISGRNSLRFLLVGMQVALAVTLLVGAGLLLRSLQKLGKVSPGFEPQQVLAFNVSMNWGETVDQKALKQMSNRLLEGFRTIPGVLAAATTTALPGVPGDYQLELKTTEGRAESEPKLLAQARWVVPGYFATMRIPLASGELCRDVPDRSTAMVNRSFVRRYYGAANVIGQHLAAPAGSFTPPAEVVGVVGDARESGLDREPSPTVYWCNTAMQPGTYILLRTRNEPDTLFNAVRTKVHELEPQRSVYNLTSLADHISDAYAENRLRTILLAFFALTAIALASVGLYGTLGYAVSLRQREVALRMAMGALRGSVVRQILREGMAVAVLGCVAGLVLAVLLGRVLASMLYGVSPTDVVTFATVVTTVLVVAGFASFLPALRAARVEPMRALRED
jgi:putative ABC transport system permease protein